jgi:hypothetical protein
MAITAQRNWRWCHKCAGLFYYGATGNVNGKCPTGGTHENSGSADYALMGDPDGNFSVGVTAQRNWRWCHKCAGLFYHGATGNVNGQCPTGGTHENSGSADYALMSDPDGNFAD